MRYLTLLAGVVALSCGAQACADEQAPNDFRFGIGVGYAFPADLGTPNVTFASFYYKGLEFQPSVVLQNSSSDHNDSVTSQHDEETTKGVGATFKYLLARRNNVDLQFIGALNYSRISVEPEGPNNNSTSKSITASYGLGVQWWFAPRFSLTATATNPLYQSTRTVAEDVGGTTQTKDVSYGIVWDPKISVAVMMWF